MRSLWYNTAQKKKQVTHLTAGKAGGIIRGLDWHSRPMQGHPESVCAEGPKKMALGACQSRWVVAKSRYQSTEMAQSACDLEKSDLKRGLSGRGSICVGVHEVIGLSKIARGRESQPVKQGRNTGRRNGCPGMHRVDSNREGGRPEGDFVDLPKAKDAAAQLKLTLVEEKEETGMSKQGRFGWGPESLWGKKASQVTFCSCKSRGGICSVTQGGWKSV